MLIEQHIGFAILHITLPCTFHDFLIFAKISWWTLRCLNLFLLPVTFPPDVASFNSFHFAFISRLQFSVKSRRIIWLITNLHLTPLTKCSALFSWDFYFFFLFFHFLIFLPFLIWEVTSRTTSPVISNLFLLPTLFILHSNFEVWPSSLIWVGWSMYAGSQLNALELPN